jgi:hypothetical protein
MGSIGTAEGCVHSLNVRCAVSAISETAAYEECALKPSGNVWTGNRGKS